MTLTAVEWLIHQYIKDGLFKKGVYEQAIEMEKQQIIDAFGIGCHHESKRLVGYQDIAEQYYSETYGSKGSDECQFEPTTNTSSATICKHCGREKFLHQ